MSSTHRTSPVDSRPPPPSPALSDGDEAISPITFSNMSSSNRNLTDVPEEDLGPATRNASRNSPNLPPMPTSPYLSSSAAASTSTVRVARKPASVRTLGKSSSDQLSVASGSTPSSVRRTTSVSSTAASQQVSVSGSGSSNRAPRVTTTTPSVSQSGQVQKYRTNPRIPHDKDAEPAPSTIMYWSRAPVWGAMPMRSMRAHTVTLVDTTAWLIGGCDDKESSKDIYCFNTGESTSYLSLSVANYRQKQCNGHISTR